MNLKTLTQYLINCTVYSYENISILLDFFFYDIKIKAWFHKHRLRLKD